MSNDNGATSVEKIQSALSFIRPDDRDIWIKAGMGIKAELGDAGQWLWDDWSQSAENYDARSAKSVWRSFKTGGKVGIGSLFYMAKDAGWTWDKPERKLTAAELAEIRETSRQKAEAEAAEKQRQQVEVAKRAEAIWAAAKPAEAHPYLSRKGIKSHGLRVGKWEIIDSTTGEVRTITPLALLVPIKDRTGKLWSLQAIFPRKLLAGRDKDYLGGGAKSGNFHAIGAPQAFEGRKVFIIAEGEATGASVHECSGHCVLVCFDTSNLLPVAASIRERQPDAIILFAADNDQFTQRKDGTFYNPGVESANKAAAEVGGLVAIPQFASLDGGPKDFNDLHQREGADVVASQIALALRSEVVEPEVEVETAPIEPPPSFEDLAAIEPEEIDAAGIQKELDEEGHHLTKNKYFTILGYDHEEYYFFVHAKQQVMCRKRGDFNTSGYLELANDINWWEMNFPASGQKGGIDEKAAMSWILHVAHSRGVYDPTNVRGRGAWLDDGRSVYHIGDILLVNGVPTQIDQISSSYVYPRARKLPRPHVAALTVEEGRRLLEVARMVRWTMQGSSVLMTGWSFLAPICGSLKWRPHIWITGAAGSGKSTIQKDFCYALTRGIARYAQGDSTEPGIRQALHSDAIPVIIDEIESNDERERLRTDSIMAMMRKASTENEAETMKGTVSGDGVNFRVRSMFCLASVNTKLDKQADIDRITKLVIRVPPRDGSQIEHWNKLEAELHEIGSDETLPSRVLSRALGMMPAVLESIKVFTRVAAKHFNSQRMGDQYGTLIAGCWCLTNDKVPTADEALAMIRAYDWHEHTEDSDQDDAQEALSGILNAKIRVPGNIGDISVYELVREAHPDQRLGQVDQDIADATLRRHGVRVEHAAKVMLFGTSVPNLKTLLKNTSCATDVRGQLLRLPGATRWENRAERFNGGNSKCVSVPLDLVFDEKPPPVSSRAVPVAAQELEDYPI
jgi:putative DNA primase/helicase